MDLNERLVGKDWMFGEELEVMKRNVSGPDVRLGAGESEYDKQLKEFQGSCGVDC